MVNLTLECCATLYEIFISRKKRRQFQLKYLDFCQRRHQLQSFHEFRRLSFIYHEKSYFLKMVAETCLLCNRKTSTLRWEKIRDKLSHDQWIKYLRMRKCSFYNLVDTLSPHFRSQSMRNVPLEKQIALTLISLASGKNNGYIGRLFRIRKSDVLKVIQNVCEAIKCLMPRYVKTRPIDVLRSIKDFERKWGFPQCTGVLGSIHLPLRTSNLPEDAIDYINSNNSYSVILQGIVDASYQFCDINIGWPGSVPESRVFTSSQIWLKGQNKNLFPDRNKVICGVDVPIYILAGTSYPLSHWVMRPFLTEPASKNELVFNEKFTFAYNVCEIAFKRLKARWNCLVRGSFNIDVYSSVIAACCILHNICEINKEVILDHWIIKAENRFHQPIPSPCNIIIGPQAENIRFAVNEYFMSST